MTVAMSGVKRPVKVTGSIRNNKSKHSKNSGSMKVQNKLNVRIIKDPGNTFYKDEGGKSNHLIASVVLEANDAPFSEEADDRRRGAAIGDVMIKPVLVYESGKEVEDADEIFNILSIEPKFITSTNQPVTLKFRIEKVSRRKDGKKFKVRFEVDSDTSIPAAGFSFHGVRPATTTAVVVLSKRKTSFSGDRSGQPLNPNLKRKASKKSEKGSKTVELSVEVLARIRDTISFLESQVVDLNHRVSHLESGQGSREMNGKGMKRERSDMGEDFNMERVFSDNQSQNRPNNYANNEAYSRNRAKANPLSYIQPMDLFDEDIKASKRSRNVDMMFDFGMPSVGNGGDRIEFFA